MLITFLAFLPNFKVQNKNVRHMCFDHSTATIRDTKIVISDHHAPMPCCSDFSVASWSLTKFKTIFFYKVNK